MELIQLDPLLIDFGDRLREVDQDWAAILAETFRRDGQVRQPIEVRRPIEGGRYRLVTGAHRVTGAILAELPVINALVFEGSDLEAELREIEENLVRHELTELDKATFLARHKAVHEALHPEVKHGGDRRKKQADKDVHLTAHPLAERFSAVAARKMGVDERTIRRSVARYAALSPAIRTRISGTWVAENGAAMDDLIGRGNPLTASEQHAVLDLLLEPTSKIRNVNAALRQLRALPPPDEVALQLEGLKKAWKRATHRDARKAFLAFIGAVRPEGN